MENTISFSMKKIEKLAKEHELLISQVKDMYIFTLDDYALLEKACEYLAKGETRADVARRIIMGWW